MVEIAAVMVGRWSGLGRGRAEREHGAKGRLIDQESAGAGWFFFLKEAFAIESVTVSRVPH